MNEMHLELENVEEGLRFRIAPVRGEGMTLDSGKLGRGPSPVDALLAALGGCIAMDVISILRKMRQQVTGYAVHVSGERREEHPRRFTRIELVHRVRGCVRRDAVEEAIRLSVTKYCSVAASLAPDIEISSRVEIEADAADVRARSDGAAGA